MKLNRYGMGIQIMSEYLEWLNRLIDTLEWILSSIGFRLDDPLINYIQYGECLIFPYECN